jgi:hypothetical protein
MRIEFYQNDHWLMKQIEVAHPDGKKWKLLTFPQDLKEGQRFRVREPSSIKNPQLLTYEGFTEFVATADCGFNPDVGEILIDCEGFVPPLQNGYYWFTSERSSFMSVGQHINGHWYLVSEEGRFTLEEINRRGWDLLGRIPGQDR